LAGAYALARLDLTYRWEMGIPEAQLAEFVRAELHKINDLKMAWNGVSDC
jgi:hypothetical protein